MDQERLHFSDYDVLVTAEDTRIAVVKKIQ